MLFGGNLCSGDWLHREGEIDIPATSVDVPLQHCSPAFHFNTLLYQLLQHCNTL